MASEYWIVAHTFAPDVKKTTIEGMRLVTVEEFEQLVENEFNKLKQKRSSKVSRARTAIGKSVLANRTQIVLLVTSLLLLIEEKLNAFNGERPNSPEAKRGRDETILQYEKVKSELTRLRDAVNQFSDGKIKERENVKSSKSFADGLRECGTKIAFRFVAQRSEWAFSQRPLVSAPW